MVITDFYVSEDERRLHAHWELSCRYTKEPRSNLLALHFIQLPALNEKDLKSRMKKWVYAFKHGREILDSEKVPSLLLDEKELVMAIKEAKKALVTDEDLRQRALSKEMMMRTQFSIVAENVEAALKRGKQEGKQEGIQIGAGQGRKEALETVVFQMLSMNMPIDTIITATGLEKSHIEELAKKINK
ncbi:MAG: PD-(D/E)XK nuclease family transposase [Candidatus Cloacimonetes bacterium]|nr:PD-(D/E)XK nuclease family transposase [Candidatus Cloacimonadota bacterium]